MQKKSASASAFFTPRALLAVVLCAGAVCSMLSGLLPATSGKLGSFRPELRTKVSQGTLTFAERVAYQRAIEEVYWRHRIWPKANATPKPPLEKVMSQAHACRVLASASSRSRTFSMPLTI